MMTLKQHIASTVMSVALCIGATVMTASIITGCARAEPVERIPAKFCTTTTTGKTGTRKWTQCRSSGKNACVSNETKYRNTEEVRTTCDYTHWRDK